MDDVKLEAVHKEALGRFKIAQDAEAENRTLALSDLVFADGDQWDRNVKEARGNRPCLVLNKIPQFVKQVVNNQRQNKPSIRVAAVDSQSDPETAEILSGLIRNIENTSRAESAYDTAFESAVKIGFGYFRVTTQYSDDDTFDQDIAVKRITNPFTVYLDPYYTEADASDIRYGFITEMVDKEEFEEEHGEDAVEISMEGIGEGNRDWLTKDQVRIAEYWRVVEDEHEISLLATGETVPSSELPEGLPEGFVINTRKSTKRRVEQYLMTGAKVISKTEWAGKWIPIIPVFGEEDDIEGKRRLKGLIRDAKDAQRLYNLWRSSSAEYVANQPKAPFIGPTSAFKTDAKKWANANNGSYSYLQYDGPVRPERQPPPPIPSGIIQEAMSASDDMKAIMGIHDASLGQRSNETSGVAIRARKMQGDMATFNFVDNLTRAMQHCGRILVDLIPKVYDTQRVIRIINPDEESEMVQINQIFIDPKTQQERKHDLNLGKYDVTVKVGPSYGTQREEAAESMMGLIAAYPPAAPIIGDLLVKNLDWPNAEEVSKRLKATLPPGIDDEGENIPKHVVDQFKQQFQQLQQENQFLKAEQQTKQMEIQVKREEVAVKREEVQVDREKTQVDREEVAVDRMKVQVEAQQINSH